MNQKESTNEVGKCVIYSSKGLDSKIAAAISNRMMSKYYQTLILHMGNGFDDVPPHLWIYKQVVIVGLSPNDMGMRTIRSMVHDKNIVWLDNNVNNIPMWTEYSMLPGDRDPKRSLTELAWRFYHDMHEPPDSLKLMIGNLSVDTLSGMI